MVVTSDYPVTLGTWFWTCDLDNTNGFDLWRVTPGGAGGHVAPYLYIDSDEVVEHDLTFLCRQSWEPDTVFLILEGDDYTTQMALLALAPGALLGLLRETADGQ